ncbi:MAG: helix-turn-helix domain-containing protein [Candidatus Aminicenantes bacterium]|jgi:AraC-like DNA-binding protein
MKTNQHSERAVKFILTRNLEELAYLTETQVANKVGVNKTYLCRIFRAVQDISIDRFILREKLHRAVFMLEKMPEISIETLSVKLGFPGTEYFIREFENYFAVKPGRYKELKYNTINKS